LHNRHLVYENHYSIGKLGRGVFILYGLGESVSEEKNKAVIRSFHRALITNNVDEALSYFTDDAVLIWGPFTFQGKEEIRRWVIELGEMARNLQFGEKSFVIQGNRVTIEFFMGLLTYDGKRGLIPGTGVYEFKNGKFQQIKITLSYGYVLIK